VLGRSNADIAADLSISLDGAKWHVGQLLTETGLDDRDQLAQWWRGERESVGGRRAVGSFLAILARAAVAAPVVLIAIWLVTANFRFSGNSDEKAQASLPATVAAPVAALPAPTPSPTPEPPGAWIFDLRDKSVRTMPKADCCLRWVDAGRLVTPLSSTAAITDLEGNVLTALPSGAVWAVAQDKHQILLYDYSDGSFTEYNADSGQVSDLVSLGPSRPGAHGEDTRSVSVAPDTSLIAVATVTEAGVVLDLIRPDGSDRRTIWTAPPDTWLTSIEWSPDGAAMLFVTKQRNLDGGRLTETPASATVVDLRGRVLLDEPITCYDARWQGSAVVLLADGGPYQCGQSGSAAIALPSGIQSQGPSLKGLFCLSPDGRYGVYGEVVPYTANGRGPTQRVVELASGAVIMEAQTRPEIGSCDWTADSTRVVLSFGGK
jgi:hypothetical protein